MIQEHEDDRGRVAVVGVPDGAGQCLLLEVARDRGLDCWVKGRSRKKVWLRADEEEVVDLLEAVRPVWRLLKLRHLEALAEAVFAAGGKPSELLLKAIKRMRLLAGIKGDESQRTHRWNLGRLSNN